MTIARDDNQFDECKIAFAYVGCGVAKHTWIDVCVMVMAGDAILFIWWLPRLVDYHS